MIERKEPGDDKENGRGMEWGGMDRLSCLEKLESSLCRHRTVARMFFNLDQA